MLGSVACRCVIDLAHLSLFADDIKTADCCASSSRQMSGYKPTGQSGGHPDSWLEIRQHLALSYNDTDGFFKSKVKTRTLAGRRRLPRRKHLSRIEIDFNRGS